MICEKCFKIQKQSSLDNAQKKLNALPTWYWKQLDEVKKRSKLGMERTELDQLPRGWFADIFHTVTALMKKSEQKISEVDREINRHRREMK
jgi:hypothetical protein